MGRRSGKFCRVTVNPLNQMLSGVNSTSRFSCSDHTMRSARISWITEILSRNAAFCALSSLNSRTVSSSSWYSRVFASSSARVLLISAHDESAIVYRALRDGAAGFLPKESTRSELVNAVLDCAKGRDIVPPGLAAGLAGEIRRRAEPDGPVLSPREREVLALIAAGSSIPAMAKELFLAPSTVKTHVQRLYEKLGVSDRAAAVAEAMRRKLLD